MRETPLVAALSSSSESAARRYQRLFVGRPGALSFLRYELLTGVLGPLSGAAGYLLRAKLYPSMFERVGRGTVFGRSTVVRVPGAIALGAHVMIDDQVVLDAKGEGSRIELGDQILLGRHTILSCTEATIRIGSFVSIGPFCFFASKSFIEIGSNVSIGSGTHVMAGGHATDDPNVPIIRQARIHRGITIGDNVWIGSGAKIIDGVTIGRDAIVGAGAVVTKDVPPWTLVMGNPARVVEKRQGPGA